MRSRLLLLALVFSLRALAQTPPCPSGVFLDVSKYSGAGSQYAKPRLDAGCEGDELVVRSNGIPHYEFVQVTPNPLLEQDQEFRVPLNPRLADKPTPIPLLGGAGFAVNGIVFFGPNEGPVPPEENFGDPIYNSIMDACMGHTALSYHYHAMVQRCLSEGVKDGERSPVLGFAYDGFSIKGPWGCLDQDCDKVVRFNSSWEKVREPHKDSWDAYDYVKKDGPEYLDQCNGHTGPGGDYHYHVTETWPYIIGCYAGDPVGLRNRGRRQPRVTERRPGPPGAPAAGRPPRGGGPGGARPRQEQVVAAAEKLGVDHETLASALRVEPGSVKPVNLAASARTLGIDRDKLTEALGARPGRRRPRVNQAPPGEPECFFRCGQSDEEAVGCTLTPEHKVVCFRPCDNNKCG